MAALDFPTSPTVGQVASLTNGFSYQWDGAVWTLTPAAPGQAAGGDLTGTYPNPTIAAGAVGNAEISDVAYAKITGAPTSLPPSGAAGGRLSGTYPNPALVQPYAGDFAITGKLTAAVPQTQVVWYGSYGQNTAGVAVSMASFTVPAWATGQVYRLRSHGTIAVAAGTVILQLNVGAATAVFTVNYYPTGGAYIFDALITLVSATEAYVSSTCTLSPGGWGQAQAASSVSGQSKYQVYPINNSIALYCYYTTSDPNNYVAHLASVLERVA